MEGYGQRQDAIRDGHAAMRERGEPGPDTDPEHLALAPLPALQGGLVMTQTGRDALALETVLGRDDQPHPLLRNP
ncbi:hypothetical protein ACFQZ0_34105 [Streptomyces erythrogriseus]